MQQLLSHPLHTNWRQSQTDRRYGMPHLRHCIFKNEGYLVGESLSSSNRSASVLNPVGSWYACHVLILSTA